MATYGERFREVRQRQGLEPADFVQRLGLKEASNVSTIEQSSRVPRPDTIIRHAEALGVAPSELMKGVETAYDRIKAGAYDRRTNRPGSEVKKRPRRTASG